MKTLFLLFILSLNCPGTLIAQITARAGFEISTYDQTANAFFKQHPDVSYMEIKYNNDLPKNVKIYYHNKPATYYFQYALSFDGDIYLLKKKYPEFPVLNSPKLKMNYISCIRNIADSSGLYSLTTTVRPDSLTLLYSFSTVTGNTYPELYPHIGPTFRGDVEKMTKKLEEEFAKWKPDIKNDSVIIFQGLVDKAGKLGQLKLVEGGKTAYSDKVLDFLTAEATAWLPRFDGSGKIPWDIRISVRVNRDHTMKISILEEISSTLYVH